MIKVLYCTEGLWITTRIAHYFWVSLDCPPIHGFQNIEICIYHIHLKRKLSFQLALTGYESRSCMKHILPNHIKITILNLTYAKGRTYVLTPYLFLQKMCKIELEWYQKIQVLIVRLYKLGSALTYLFLTFLFFSK